MMPAACIKLVDQAAGEVGCKSSSSKPPTHNFRHHGYDNAMEFPDWEGRP